MEEKREVDTRALSDQKEDDELGQFFAKLATLVPKLQCGLEGLNSTSQEPPLSGDPWTQQGSADTSCRRCGADTHQIECDCSSNEQNLIREAHEADDSHINFIFTAENNEVHPKITSSNCNLRSNFDSSISSSQPIMCCTRNQSNRRLSGSNYVIKPCKVRNRLAPYRINKHDPRNHSTSSKIPSRPTSLRNHLQSSGEPQAEEQRLELITDVIEYIHNLKSLLDGSQTKRYDIGSDLHLLPQRPLQEGRYGAPPPAPLPPQGLVTPPVGGTTFLGEAAPLDRAMELLEYKTGAISITA